MNTNYILLLFSTIVPIKRNYLYEYQILLIRFAMIFETIILTNVRLGAYNHNQTVTVLHSRLFFQTNSDYCNYHKQIK